MTSQVKGCLPLLQFDLHHKPPRVQETKSFFPLSYFCLKKNEECDINKGLLHSKETKQSGHWFACCGGNKTRKDSTGSYKHLLINLIRLSVKDTQENTGRSDQWRRKAAETKVLCGKRAKTCKVFFRSSSSPQARGKAKLKQAMDDSSHEGEGIN